MAVSEKVQSIGEACAGLVNGSAKVPCYHFRNMKAGLSTRVRSFGELSQMQLAENGSGTNPAKSDILFQEETDETEHFKAPHQSLLNQIIIGEWEDRNQLGLFKYDVTACKTKLIPGSLGFIAQLNTGRGTKKRQTEFNDDVAQNFNDGKFNFLKANDNEILFQFSMSTKSSSHFTEQYTPKGSIHLVIINVAPIDYGHILLLPHVAEKLPQQLSPRSVMTALQFAVEADNPYMRVGYNSLGAYGTVNHLHFQAYYLGTAFPVERCPVQPLYLPASSKVSGSEQLGGNDSYVHGVRVQKLVGYPVNCLVFEQVNSSAELAHVVGIAAQRLSQMNIPHNLLICDAGTRVFLFPQRYGARKLAGDVPEDILETDVNPGCFEIAGHMVFKRQQDFDNYNQSKCWEMLELASFDDDEFTSIAAKCLSGLEAEE